MISWLIDKKIVLLLFGGAIFLIVFCIFPKSQALLFFNGTKDFGADFFNTIIYLAERNPYDNPINGVENKCYLPLAYLLLEPFSYGIDYKQMTLQSCWHNNICLVSLFVFTLLSVCLWFGSVTKVLRKYHLKSNNVLVFALSSIFFYTVERGNWILVSAALVNLYVCYHDSDSLRERIFAMICLSFASVLKIFPAIFIVLTLQRKEYKLFVQYLLISAMLSILPFFYYKGGLENIALLYRNVSMQTASYSVAVSPYRFGLSGFVCLTCAFFHTIPNMMLVKLLNYMVLLLSLAAIYKGNKKYKIVLLACIPALFPFQAFAYNVIYLLPFAYVLISEMSKQRKYLYVALFVLMTQPFQLVYSGFSLSYVLSNVCSLLLWIVTICFAFIKDYCYDTAQSKKS